MAYTTPKSWATNDLLTATDMNTHIRDNISWLATDKPTVRAKRTSNQSIPNATFTILTFDGEDWDSASMHSTVSNAGRLTIPTGGGGKYLVGGFMYWQANVTGRRVARLYKNVDTNILIEQEFTVNAGISSGSVTAMDSAVAGDFFEIKVLQTSGGALNVDAVSVVAYFWCTWMGT